MVSEPTHHNNILDLVIMTEDSRVSDIAVGEHLHSCDDKKKCASALQPKQRRLKMKQ